MRIPSRLIELRKGISPAASAALAHVRLACCLHKQQAHLAVSSAGPSMENSSHAIVTSSSPRQPILADAQIQEVSEITPSVKRLRLRVEDERFGFQPGQWVDFHAPGVPTIGGYSIVSPPSQLKELHSFDIAVKESRHPPAHWVHTKAAAGVPVKIQVGGDFVLSEADLERPLIFVAGGIGITPLMAMLSHYVERVPSLLQRKSEAAAKLLYSASSADELAFKKELDELSRRSLGTLDVTYFITRGPQKNSDQHHEHVEDRRIHVGDLTHAMQQISANHPEAQHDGPIIFLCGPPGMISQFVQHAQEGLGIPSRDVRKEQWW